jgi:hybrid cluster-associated redox disulfide protein
MPDAGQLAEMMISEVLARWPATADVFHRHAMACVGCVVAPFYTVSDAANVYSLQKETFIAELSAVIRAAEHQNGRA